MHSNAKRTCYLDSALTFTAKCFNSRLWLRLILNCSWAKAVRSLETADVLCSYIHYRSLLEELKISSTRPSWFTAIPKCKAVPLNGCVEGPCWHNMGIIQGICVISLMVRHIRATVCFLTCPHCLLERISPPWLRMWCSWLFSVHAQYLVALTATRWEVKYISKLNQRCRIKIFFTAVVNSTRNLRHKMQSRQCDVYWCSYI